MVKLRSEVCTTDYRRKAVLLSVVILAGVMLWVIFGVVQFGRGIEQIKYPDSRTSGSLHFVVVGVPIFALLWMPRSAGQLVKAFMAFVLLGVIVTVFF